MILALETRLTALSEAREAVHIYEELARRNPDAFQPDLAMSLNNLGRARSGSGRRRSRRRQRRCVFYEVNPGLVLGDGRIVPASPPPPERMTAVLARVHKVLAAVDEGDLDMDPALRVCVHLASRRSTSIRSSASQPPGVA